MALPLGQIGKDCKYFWKRVSSQCECYKSNNVQSTVFKKDSSTWINEVDLYELFCTMLPEYFGFGIFWYRVHCVEFLVGIESLLMKDKLYYNLNSVGNKPTYLLKAKQF